MPPQNEQNFVKLQENPSRDDIYSSGTALRLFDGLP